MRVIVSIYFEQIPLNAWKCLDKNKFQEICSNWWHEKSSNNDTMWNDSSLCWCLINQSHPLIWMKHFSSVLSVVVVVVVGILDLSCGADRLIDKIYPLSYLGSLEPTAVLYLLFCLLNKPITKCTHLQKSKTFFPQFVTRKRSFEQMSWINLFFFSCACVHVCVRVCANILTSVHQIRLSHQTIILFRFSDYKANLFCCCFTISILCTSHYYSELLSKSL